MNIPDYVSPIVAHRVWQWDGAVLVSLNGERWQHGQRLEAECCVVSGGRSIGCSESAHARHRAPQMDCTCGIYAVKTLEQLAGRCFRFHGVWGEVYLWGTIIEHSFGWRAQFAYPKSLLLLTEMIPYGAKEAESILATLTAYGADILLASGEGNTRLWTKATGYDKVGLDSLRVVANQPIDSPMPVALFTEEPERQKFFEGELKAPHAARIVCCQVGFPDGAAEPVLRQIREQRVRVVLVDLNSRNLTDSIRAITVIRAASDLSIVAIGEMRDPHAIVAAMRAGADEYLDRHGAPTVSEYLQMYARLRHAKVRWPSRPKPQGGSTPPGRSSPPGGSTPPAAPVYVPWRGGPRPMRPREVALAV